MSEELETVARRSNWAAGDALVLSPATQRPRQRQVRVQGSKNAAQKLIPIAASAPGRYVFTRLPLIRDTFAQLRIVEFLGGSVGFDGEYCVVDTRSIRNRPVPRELTRQSTGTFQFLGAMLARFGSAQVAGPGGDRIGARPVGIHLDALRVLGATVRGSEESYVATAPDSGLVASDFQLPVPSVGAAMNFLIAASSCSEEVTLRSAAFDADVEAALELLRATGAVVSVSPGVNASVDISIRRAEDPPTYDVEFLCPPDRNDAASWAVFASCTPGETLLTDTVTKDLERLLNFLGELSVEMQVHPHELLVHGGSHLVAPTEPVVCGPSPQLHSDWAQPISAMLTQCVGRSVLLDAMYEGRYTQLAGLRAFGAAVEEIEVTVPRGALMYDQEATTARALEITGVAHLQGAPVEARDVRGGFALVLAASRAVGVSVVSGIDQLSRGYEMLPSRLAEFGLQWEVR